MSDSPHSTPGEGDVSRAYFLALNPPPVASVEERSAWDMSRWSTRPYRWPYPSTRYDANEDGPLVPDGSPESIPFDRLSLQSTTDSQESEMSPLTPTHESFTPDDHGGPRAKPVDDEESYHDRVFRARRDRNPDESNNHRPAVHQLRGATLGRPSNFRGMGYLARIGINEEDYNAANSSMKMLIVELLADTGSDLTWSLGVNLCQIAYVDTRTQNLQNNPPADPAAKRHTDILLTEWIPAEIRYAPPHSGLSHDLDFRTAAQWQDSQPEFEVRYVDGCEAYLIGRERGITFNCYNSESDSVNDVTLKMRWAIAYAVNSKLRWSNPDGVLGMSFYDHQDDGGRVRMAFPEGSFLFKLRESLPILRNGAFVIYFTARPHASYNPGKRVQSWVAFNQWPASEKPTFSKHIPLHRNAYRHHCWSVTLLRIEVQRQLDDGYDVLYREEYPDGLEVLVDSGSSTSELPYRTVNAIHTTVFRNSDPLPPSTSCRPTYHIPDDFQIHLYRVRLVFKGDRGREDVVIYAPFKHFVCARDLAMWPHNITICPWKGVIFAAHKDTPFGVLGLNFFQTMFISFHKGIDDIHYLRMSAQGEDVEKYEVRFPSDSDSDD